MNLTETYFRFLYRLIFLLKGDLAGAVYDNKQQGFALLHYLNFDLKNRLNLICDNFTSLFFVDFPLWAKQIL